MTHPTSSVPRRFCYGIALRSSDFQERTVCWKHQGDPILTANNIVERDEKYSDTSFRPRGHKSKEITYHIMDDG